MIHFYPSNAATSISLINRGFQVSRSNVRVGSVYLPGRVPFRFNIRSSLKET